MEQLNFENEKRKHTQRWKQWGQKDKFKLKCYNYENRGIAHECTKRKMYRLPVSLLNCFVRSDVIAHSLPDWIVNVSNKTCIERLCKVHRVPYKEAMQW